VLVVVVMTAVSVAAETGTAGPVLELLDDRAGQAPGTFSLQEFYQDFRNRLLGHAPAKATKPVPPAPGPAKTLPPPPVVSTDHPQFIYVDREGQLQFADSLEEIPTEFRGQAQKLAQ